MTSRRGRRTFLKALLVGAGAGCVALLGVYRSARVRRWIGRDHPLPPAPAPPAGALTEQELRTIVALAEVLIPADETPGADADWARAYIGERIRTNPDYLREYRNAVVLLNRLAGTTAARSFHELPAAGRDALIAAHFDPQGPGDRAHARYWRYVIKDLLVGFYNSPAGWAVVGYTHYPGVPGHPRNYTTALPSAARE